MRPAIVFPRRSARPVALAIAASLGALAGSAAIIQSCSREPRSVSRPAIVADPTSFVIAWEAASPEGSAIYTWRAQRREQQLQTLSTAATTAIYQGDKLRHTIELARGRDRLMVFAHPEHSNPIAIPVHTDGTAAGRAVEFPDRPESGQLYARLCRGPIANGDAFAVGFVQATINGYDLLGLAFIDSEGGYLGETFLGIMELPISDCAMVRKGDTLLVAARTSQGLFDHRVTTAVISAIDGTPLAPTRDWPSAADSPLAVAPRDGGWALLFADSDDAPRVAYLDDGGQPISHRRLPTDLSQPSADLAASARGLFVTDASDGLVRITGVDDPDHQISHPSKSHPSATRALGFRGQCIVAWSTRAGRTVRVMWAGSCP